ncbi:uncharacterized protein G2W53_031694 [Senna tora]|uniref:Uncharacterized protein n=1 Tax=Senna tora TaxID=362788 RepID=A0A834SW84_9FABA|nr:uncharacterized protein G2W53_031694 [Senna tora]
MSRPLGIVNWVNMWFGEDNRKKVSSQLILEFCLLLYFIWKQRNEALLEVMWNESQFYCAGFGVKKDGNYGKYFCAGRETYRLLDKDASVDIDSRTINEDI